jgi:threonine dehydrogenase-like Zn-dependent dehydrogenase
MVRPRGTIVIKAWPLPVEASSVKHERLNLSAALSAEASILGSGPGTLSHLEEAVDLLAQRKIDVEPLMSRRYPLRQYEAAYTQAAMPDTACVLLDLSAS